MAVTQWFSQDAIREWLQKAVKTSGLSPHALALKAGISPTTLTRFVYGRATHLPTFRTLKKVADAAGVEELGARLWKETGLDWDETGKEASKDPIGDLWGPLMEITYLVQGVQKDARTGAFAHPEIEEFRAILEELDQAQDRLRVLVQKELAKLSEASAAANRKQIVAVPAGPEIVHDQPPRRSRKTAA